MKHTDRKFDLRMNRREAAKYLGVSPETLSVWAATGRYHLPYFKAGKKAVYRQSDLDDFIESRMKGNVGEVVA